MGLAEQKVKLEELARYLYELMVLFEKDDKAANSELYRLLNRLFHEHCELTHGEASDEEDP